MPLVNGIQTRDEVSPDSNADIIGLLIIAEIIDLAGFSAVRAIAQTGQVSPNVAMGLLETAAVAAAIPPGVVSGIILYIGKEKFFKKLEEIAAFGLLPNGFYVWGNEEKNLPTGEFTADSIFFTGGVPYKLRSPRIEQSIYDILGVNPEQLLGILGWLPGVPNFDWLAVWETPGQTKVVPQISAQLESVLKNPPPLVNQQIDLTKANPFLNQSTNQRSKTKDSDVSVKTGVEINTTLLLLAGALAFTKARLISIPIALAAIRSK